MATLHTGEFELARLEHELGTTIIALTTNAQRADITAWLGGKSQPGYCQTQALQTLGHIWSILQTLPTMNAEARNNIARLWLIGQDGPLLLIREGHYQEAIAAARQYKSMITA